MKATIEVKDRQEAGFIKMALDDQAVKAFVVIVGALKGLPTLRQRQRALQYAQDIIAEETERMAEDRLPESVPRLASDHM